MDFLLSGSVFAAHADLLSFLPGVGRLQPLRPGEPVILSDTVRLLPVPADHKDLTGRKDGAIGFLLELTDDTDSCRVGFTGDTALFEGVPEVLAETDLLVVNVGSIYPSDLGLDSPDGCGHLGLNGTIKYLGGPKEVHGELKPLLLLSEWGEELGPFRRQLCEVIAERGGVDPRRVWPAEEMAKVALWPGDAHPVCSSCNTRIAQVVKSLPGSDLAYHCEEGAH